MPLIPVADLATSAAWYRDLLGLAYVREFSDGESETGCSLAAFSVPYVTARRLRSTTAGRADPRGRRHGAWISRPNEPEWPIRTTSQVLEVALRP